MPSQAPPPSTQNRLADRALVLALATFLMLTPPVIAVFDVAVSLFGIPLLHFYTFTVWIAAIVVGGILARRISRQAESQPRQDADGS